MNNNKLFNSLVIALTALCGAFGCLAHSNPTLASQNTENGSQAIVEVVHAEVVIEYPDQAFVVLAE